MIWYDILYKLEDNKCPKNDVDCHLYVKGKCFINEIQERCKEEVDLK